LLNLQHFGQFGAFIVPDDCPHREDKYSAPRDKDYKKQYDGEYYKPVSFRGIMRYV
jgi:hypothetical protein